MRKFFYPKLAAMNIWKNRRVYVPYILTCICNIAMFYMMFYMNANPDLATVPGREVLATIMFLGVVVMGIFSLIFLCYSNSFLIKRRKKEFGLYNVLGMEKRHIRWTLCWEMAYVVVISYVVGFALGIMGSKLLFLFLLKLLEVPAQFGFIISGEAMSGTCFWFLGIFILTLLLDMWQIHLASPVELLRGGNAGEKEPKAKWLLALIGMICLGSGYYIAVSTTNPLDALLLFFVAVILVMIGTYCLFTAGSIAVLKMLRWNKKFYYQTRHFTSISGMIYRMKQNAVGLANVCILSTGVLIMISGTVSMYAGMGDIMNTRYPHDVEYTIQGSGKENFGAAVEDRIVSSAQEAGIEIRSLNSYNSLSFSTVGSDGNLELLDYSSQAIGSINAADLVTVAAMTLEDYNRIMGEDKTLGGENEILLYPVKGSGDLDTLTIYGKEYQVKEVIDSCPYVGEMSTYVGGGYYIVVKDMAQLEELEALETAVYGDMASHVERVVQADLEGTAEEKEAFETSLNGEIDAMSAEQFSQETDLSYRADMKQMEYQSFYALYGGLFFLGIFLGVLFLMGTTLIIYYKQVSEGYDDRERFEIMQKVGMSKKEVRQSIKSQVLMVFFLPLLMAWMHIAFAFPMITRMLSALNMYNVQLFALCTVVTAAVFALVYAAIYGVTARTYYKIVEGI